MKIVDKKIADLNPAVYNPRKITEKQLADLVESIAIFGVTEPCIVNTYPGRENNVVSGHQRLKALKKLKFKKAPCVEVSLTEDRERELNIRMNKNTGSFDFDLLEEFFTEGELITWGFEADDLNFSFDYDAKTDEDQVPEEVETICKIGDLWTLGDHRLLCGDARSKEDVKKLMNGHKADMVFTDPPYNVNYSGEGKNTSRTIKNDNMAEVAFKEFLLKTFEAYKEAVKISAPFYICHSSSSQIIFEEAMKKTDLIVKSQIIWNKVVASMGWGDYRWKHEPLFYATYGKKNTNFYGDRTNYTVWDEKWDNRKIVSNLKRIAKKFDTGGSTVWKLGRDSNYLHPTQKPVQLLEIAFKNSSKREDLIVDFFLGSGTTIIASEKTNRKCYGMELEEHLCDVIIKRFEDFTGKKAEKIN